MAVLHEIRGKVENILGDKKKAELLFEQDLDEDIKKLASNQGDITNLLLQVIQVNTKLGGEVNRLRAEKEIQRVAYSDVTTERDILRDKLEQALSTLEYPAAACVVCMVEVGRNENYEKGKSHKRVRILPCVV